MDIQLPQENAQSVYDFGFDKSLNRTAADNSTALVNDTFELGTNASILNANFSVNSGPSAFTGDGKATTVSPIGSVQITPVGSQTAPAEVDLIASDGLPNSTNLYGGGVNILAGYGRGTNYNDAETAHGGYISIIGGGASKNGTAGPVDIVGGAGAFTAGVGNGARASLTGGIGAATSGDGGPAFVAGGNSFLTGTGGIAYMNGGNGGVSSGNGGDAKVYGGSALFNNNNGGFVYIFAGNGLPANNPTRNGTLIIGNPGYVAIQKHGGAGGNTDGQHAIFNANNIATTDKTFTFPNKSGMFALTGTFSVQLPAVAATTSVFSTIATVAGIRKEDALTVIMSNQGVSAGYATTTTAKIFYSAVPGNGNMTLNFFNLGASTGYTEHTFSYTAASSAQ